jgi:protein-S-isoprenylcysteine O-methyltransferase Ste14
LVSAMRASSSWARGLPAGRGTGWVVAQFALMAAIMAAGFVPPDWPEESHRALSVVGAALAIAGGVLAVWGSRALGRSFTPFPKPVEAGLVTSGPFKVVRNPVYAGGIMLFAGYSLYASVPALALTVVLAVLWAGKARVEERMLTAAYQEYPAYKEHVRWRLIPFVF